MRYITCLIIATVSGLSLFGVIDTPVYVDLVIFAMAVALVWNTMSRNRSDHS